MEPPITTTYMAIPFAFKLGNPLHHQEAKVSEAWKALRSSIAASKEQLQGKAKCLEESVHVAFME